jgi:hypothetical protein
MYGTTNTPGSPTRPQKQRFAKANAPISRRVMHDSSCKSVHETAKLAGVVWFAIVLCGLYGLYAFQTTKDAAGQIVATVADVLSYQELSDTGQDCETVAATQLTFPPMTFDAHAIGRQHILLTVSKLHLWFRNSPRYLFVLVCTCVKNRSRPLNYFCGIELAWL